MFNSGVWNLTCKKSFTYRGLAFNQGQTYRVKDKFPGPTGSLEDGYWEISCGGSLVSLSAQQRLEYFYK